MITIKNLNIHEVSRGASMLVRAFAADPIITFFLIPSARGRMAFRAFFRAVIHEHCESGHVYAAWNNGSLVGVAVWAPPGGVSPNRSASMRSAINHAIVKFLFPKRSRGLYNGFEATASLHPEEPHWYLAFVGVEPDWQGKKVGKQLLGPVLNTADADNRLCYLETPFSATHEFYKRLGFHPVTEAKPFQGAPALWTMVRYPSRPAK